MARRKVSLKEIEDIRARLWRTAPTRQIAGESGAVRFIRELGFVLLMPISGAELPSLHRATRDPWSWWDWKQTLPGRKACYYGKLLRRRGTFVSWDWYPFFHAAYAERRSYRRLYHDGLLSREEKLILDLLAERGPLMTGDIRLAFGAPSKQNTRHAKSLLVDLQRRFLITAAGGSTEGWSHHRWDLVERWVPARHLAAAQSIAPEEARRKLVAQFCRNMHVTTAADIAWLFGWGRAEVDGTVAGLLEAGDLECACAPELGGDVLVYARRRGGAQ